MELGSLDDRIRRQIDRFASRRHPFAPPDAKRVSAHPARAIANDTRQPRPLAPDLAGGTLEASDPRVLDDVVSRRFVPNERPRQRAHPRAVSEEIISVRARIEAAHGPCMPFL